MDFCCVVKSLYYIVLSKTNILFECVLDLRFGDGKFLELTSTQVEN